MSTLYASFATPSDAERAAGAMLDHGARAADISVLANQQSPNGQPIAATQETVDAERAAKSGFSTTTPYDVAAGTIKGATIGIGIGTLAALAALFIPGVGLVLGGGAFAAALMGGAGTAIAGAAAGGIAGFLADQGIPEDVVTRYSSTFEQGGAILAIAVPSGNLTDEDAEALIVKYGASNIATVNAPRVLADGLAVTQPDPLVVQGDNPDIAPVAYAVPPIPVPTNDPLAQQPVVIPVQPKTTADDVDIGEPTPEPLVDVIDPITGNVIRRPVDTIIPNAENRQISTLTPNTDVVKDTAGDYHQTVGNPLVVSEQPVVITDAETGLRRAAKVVETQRAVVRQLAPVDDDGHVSMAADGPEETILAREKHIEYPD